MTENITLRQRKKAQTRAKIIKAARKMFAQNDYHAVTTRDVTKAAGLSTGAMFGSFTGKEQLFTEAMGFPPPVDGPLTRAAPILLKTIREASKTLEISSRYAPNGEMARLLHLAHSMCEASAALATSPLDGEVWARHLESIRRDVPHDCRAEQPAASQPSDAAGDQ